jgi:hypothetical protein
MADTETQFESDAFLKLLTDALRAGPGSPQWHEAVTQLRAGSVNGADSADEYRLLVAARENLESGREYRSVRAGPGFTRKVLEGIEREGEPRPSKLPPAGLLAILGVAGIVIVVAVVVGLIIRNAGNAEAPSDLANMQFLQTLVGGDFAEDIPQDWRTFGLEPLISERGQALRASWKKDAADFVGGGIVLRRGLAPGEAFMVDATVRVKGRINNDLAVQVFVTDQPDFERSARASTPHELVVYLSGGQWSAADASGKLSDRSVKARDVNHIVVKLDAEQALVEADGQVLFSGKHGLSKDRARYPGVRFLTRGPERGGDDVTVPMVRVLKP